MEEGEYELIDCTEIESNKWFCECYDSYDLILSTTTRTINNYTFTIEYLYQQEEDTASGGSSGGGSGGSSSSRISCNEWTECEGGKSTQYCYDLDNDNINYIKNRSCIPEAIENQSIKETTTPTIEVKEEPKKEVTDTKEEKSYMIFWVMGGLAIVLIIVGLGFWFWKKD